MNYQKPDALTAHVFNPLVGVLVRLGRSPRGAHLLEVRGRKTGEWRTTPVNPVDLEGQRYLVAPRGDTQWARNLRAGSDARLRLGRRQQPITAVELPEEARPPILRAYLARWQAEAGKFFGLAKDASDEELERIAPAHPVFRVVPAEAAA